LITPARAGVPVIVAVVFPSNSLSLIVIPVIDNCFAVISAVIPIG
jgi:hypothetical protein